MSLIFWNILLAHFLGDYPLQPAWMVRRKDHLGILTLHVTIHLVVLLLIAGVARRLIFPQLIALAVIHFGIDFSKNLLNKARPQWVILPYIIDQTIHYLSIGLVTYWIWTSYGSLNWTLNLNWAALLTAYLVVTYVWFVSERVLAYAQPGYRGEVIRMLWPRMVMRAIFLSLILIVLPVTPLAITARLIAQPVPEHRVRSFLTDIGVSAAVAAVLWLGMA
jgi:hypothetical protein